MAPESRVEVVLVNYKRPGNIHGIVQAFRQQTVPCQVTLIDAAPDPSFRLSPEDGADADIIYSWNCNFGPYNRYVPIGAYSREFTYFHDDDMLPGRQVIDHFLKAADQLSDFGVIGQQGRYVGIDGAYDPAGVARKNHFVPVDSIVRGYFVQTKHLPAVIEHRHAIGLPADENLEDDLLLSTAMTMIHGLTNYLTPRHPDPETSMNKSELSAPFARYVRGNHSAVRTEFCRRVIAAGWTPIAIRNTEHRASSSIDAIIPGDARKTLEDSRDIGAQGPAQPLVSCICSTYNRPPGHQYLVEEAIESFLRQTYPNKELIVLNDCPGQELVCDAPDVRMVNVPERFPTLGDKHNAAIALARGELLAVWDDDDVNLPWRLALSVERLGEADYFNPKIYWFMVRDQLRPDLRTNIGFNLSLFRRTAFEAVGRFPSIGSGVDLALDRELRAKVRCIGDGANGEDLLPPSEVYYIYRWGVSPAHLSASNSTKERSDNYERVGMRPVQEGTFLLHPHWHVDYVAATRSMLESSEPRGTPASVSSPIGGSPERSANARVAYESAQAHGVVALAERIRQVEAELAKLQTDFARLTTALDQWFDHDDAGDERASSRQGKGKKNGRR